MRNKNTLRKLEYVCDSIYWTALIFLLYRISVFCPVFTLSYTQSAVVLAGSTLAGFIVGILLTYKRRRNYVSIFCNLTLSIAPYYLVSFWSITRKALIISACVAIVVLLMYCSMVFFSYICCKKEASSKASGWQWCRSCFLGCRTLLSIVLAFLLFGTMLKPVIGMPVLEFKADATTETVNTNDDGETISKNIETLLLLQEESWCKLDTTAKLKVMKTVADIEANYLGIEKMTVCTEPLDENTLGCYNDSTKTITLNLSYLSTEKARTMLSTLCHECYHSYQHRLVDLYNQMDGETRELLLFQDASHYKKEFACYIDGSEDFQGYSTQWCELDSDEYAEDAVVDYYYRIYQYIKENNGGDMG